VTNDLSSWSHGESSTAHTAYASHTAGAAGSLGLSPVDFFKYVQFDLPAMMTLAAQTKARKAAHRATALRVTQAERRLFDRIEALAQEVQSSAGGNTDIVDQAPSRGQKRRLKAQGDLTARQSQIQQPLAPSQAPETPETDEMTDRPTIPPSQEAEPSAEAQSDVHSSRHKLPSKRGKVVDASILDEIKRAQNQASSEESGTSSRTRSQRAHKQKPQQQQQQQQQRRGAKDQGVAEAAQTALGKPRRREQTESEMGESKTKRVQPTSLLEQKEDEAKERLSGVEHVEFIRGEVIEEEPFFVERSHEAREDLEKRANTVADAATAGLPTSFMAQVPQTLEEGQIDMAQIDDEFGESVPVHPIDDTFPAQDTSQTEVDAPSEARSVSASSSEAKVTELTRETFTQTPAPELEEPAHAPPPPATSEPTESSRRRRGRERTTRVKPEIEAEEEVLKQTAQKLVLDHGPDWASQDDSAQRVRGGRATSKLLREIAKTKSSARALDDGGPDQEEVAAQIAGELALRTSARTRRSRRQAPEPSGPAVESTEAGELHLEADEIEL